MLAGAVRAYANRWAVKTGERVAVFTNNDDGLRTARDLNAKGVEVVAVIDAREGDTVIDTSGRLGIKTITLRDKTGRMRTLGVDILAVSGGWNPNVNIHSHHRARPVWDATIAAFVPGPDGPPGLLVAGAAAGVLTTHGALRTGRDAAVAALGLTGVVDLPDAEDAPVNVTPFWHVSHGKGRAWIDQQNDVTVKDIKLAAQENFTSVEHMKRYTTLGMATDQGKTGNVIGLAIMAELTGRSIPQTGTTIYRPPYTPVALGALAGRSRGKEFKPYRLTPSHHWAAAQGAVFVEVGNWLRTQWVPVAGETEWRQSVDREVLATRKSVGICDVTTLGKIDIQGTDAGVFLDKVYANTFSTLPVGKCRYGLMLREDGIVFDDGTTARLGEYEYVMTTTTANAVTVFRHLEFCRQCLWPDLDVQLISTTEAWAQFSVAGPNARRLLQNVVDQDISDAAFPYMAAGRITVCGGLRARLFRISFSGELAYEIAVPTRYGDGLLREMLARGAAYDPVVYGTEALGVMRIEKGHVAGGELNGQSTALNMGLGKMVSKKKDAIGMVLSQREGLTDDNGYRLVGVRPVDPKDKLVAGSHFLAVGAEAVAANDAGWLTSKVYSPHIGSDIALGYLKGGDRRIGARHFIDPQGERLRG
jgi:sarcosine oxidase subunit alpha